MKRLLVWVVLFLSFVFPLYASSSLRGFVVDSSSGEPLPIATVIITGTERGAATNLDGFFVIPALQPGTYTVEASYLGYRTTSVQIDFPVDIKQHLVIQLEPNAVALEEVVYSVVENDEDALRLSPSVSTVPLSPEALREVPSLMGEQDVMRAIQAVPGVKSSSELSSALYVRGGNRDMTLLALDQCTVYNPAHMFGLFSTFNSDAVKHVTLMKGGFPAEYGGRTGSVLQVVTNDGNRRRVAGSAMISLISSRAAIEGPLPSEAGSYAVSARRTYFDPIISALHKVDEKGFADLPNYYFYDTNGKLTLDLSSSTTLTVGAYLGRDDLEGGFGDQRSKEEIETFWGNRTIYARLRQVVGSSSFLTVSGAHSRYHSGFSDYNEGILLARLNNHFHETALRADYEMMGLEHHRIKTGIQVSRYSTDFLIENEKSVLLAFDDAVYNTSHYLQDDWRISAAWELRGGLRWYHHDRGDYWRFDPRLAVVHHWSDHLRFKLAWGQYTQWVNIVAQGETFSALDIWTAVDGTVDPTWSEQVVLGVEYETDANREATFELYYTKLHDLLFFDENSENSQTMQDAYRSGEGYALGFEWMMRQKVGRMTGWLGYSFSVSRQRYPGTDINDGDWFFPKWDRRNDFIVVGSYHLSNNWSVSASWIYNTGQGYTRAVGVMTREFAHLNPAFNGSGGRDVVYGKVNNYRLPADHRLDLTFSRSHKFLKRYPATFNISIYNVYSRRAIFYRAYDTEVNPVRENDVRLLPILPLVSYEVKF